MPETSFLRSVAQGQLHEIGEEEILWPADEADDCHGIEFQAHEFLGSNKVGHGDPRPALLDQGLESLSCVFVQFRIRNAQGLGQWCACRKCREEEGYIRGYAREEDGKQGLLQVTLKYSADRTPVITGIRRVSKPSLRVYTGKRETRLVRSGLGISIVTTSKGVMTDRQARRENVGGEVLCEVW